MSFQVEYTVGRKRLVKSFGDGYVMNIVNGVLTIVDTTGEHPEVVEAFSGGGTWHAEKT